MKLILTVSFLLHAVTCNVFEPVAQWSYLSKSDFGPHNWGKFYPECSSKRSYSPLDLTFDKSTFSPFLKPAKFEGLWVKKKISVSLTVRESQLILKLHPLSQVRLGGLNLATTATGTSSKISHKNSGKETSAKESQVKSTTHVLQEYTDNSTDASTRKVGQVDSKTTPGPKHTADKEQQKNKIEKEGNHTDFSHVLKQCLFHWGNSSFEDGSEHMADFREAHMEMQCEFMLPQDMMRDFDKAKSFLGLDDVLIGKKRRIMISTFVIFVENIEDLGAKKNSGWIQLLKRLKSLREEATSKVAFEMTHRELLQMFSPDWSSYYMYNGSLTYPPCTKDVTWYVFTEPVILARKLATNLYSLGSKSQDAVAGQLNLKDNRRPAIKHYNRTVLRSFSINDNIIQMQQNVKTFDKVMQAILDPVFETMQQHSKGYGMLGNDGKSSNQHLRLQLKPSEFEIDDARNLAAVAKNRPLKWQLDRMSNSVNGTKNKPRHFYRKLAARNRKTSYGSIETLCRLSRMTVTVILLKNVFTHYETCYA